MCVHAEFCCRWTRFWFLLVSPAVYGMESHLSSRFYLRVATQVTYILALLARTCRRVSPDAMSLFLGTIRVRTRKNGFKGVNSRLGNGAQAEWRSSYQHALAYRGSGALCVLCGPTMSFGRLLSSLKS